MSDPQVPTESNQDEPDPRFLAFRRKSSIGVYHFFFDFWPAWMVDGEAKDIAPFCRIIIGDDDDGSVLIDKNVLLTGLLHLISDLTNTVEFNIERALKLPGLTMSVPGGKPHVLELIDDIEDSFKDIREMIESNRVIAGVDDDDAAQK